MKKSKFLKIQIFVTVLIGLFAIPMVIIASKVHADGTPPSVITGFDVEYNSGSDVVHVSWGIPSDPGSSPITGY